MSVIYKTLQRVKTQSEEDIHREIQLKKERQIFFLRKNRFLRPWVFFLVVSIFLGGIGVSYGIYHIRNLADDATGPVIVVRKVKSQERPTRATNGQDRNPAEDQPVGPQFLPAATGNNSLQQITAGVAPENRFGLSSKRQGTPVSGNEPPPVPTANKLKDPPISTAGSADSIANPSSGGSPTEYEVKDNRMAKIYQSHAKTSYRISRLVAKIRRSMLEMNHPRTKELLDRLATLKGPDNSYVLKLKSYWHLQQGDYPSAMVLLKQVLDRNENDLEAGINMAIVEIKTHRYRQADQRLAHLRETYPEDTRIAEIMEKLKSASIPLTQGGG